MGSQAGIVPPSLRFALCGETIPPRWVRGRTPPGLPRFMGSVCSTVLGNLARLCLCGEDAVVCFITGQKKKVAGTEGRLGVRVRGPQQGGGGWNRRPTPDSGSLPSSLPWSCAPVWRARGSSSATEHPRNVSLVPAKFSVTVFFVHRPFGLWLTHAACRNCSGLLHSLCLISIIYLPVRLDLGHGWGSNPRLTDAVLSGEGLAGVSPCFRAFLSCFSVLCLC